MNDYKAILELDFDQIVTIRDSLRIAKGVYENMPGASAYSLANNNGYVYVCKVLELVSKHLA